MHKLPLAARIAMVIGLISLIRNVVIPAVKTQRGTFCGNRAAVTL